MQFIEALKLRSKLFFLFIMITIGLVGVGIIGAINIDSMKKNIDSLYFGSLVPVTELNEIVRTYHSGLAATLYKAKNGEMSSQEATSNLENSLKKINKQWKNYEDHFKRDEELEYVEYVSYEIKTVNKHFLKLLGNFRSNFDASKISMSTTEKYVFHISNVLQKLINYEVEIAQYGRKKFLQVYESTLLNLKIILALIIIAVLVISYMVFSSIQKDHEYLEIATKKLKRANKKLESVSYTDSLTSMHNRRYFNLVYEKELKRAKRTHSYITFMMLDIDYFKQYNDTYGHLEGDKALQEVSKVLQETLKRPSDFVFRLGGEEFGVLLTQTDESSSAKLAREICDVVRGKKIPHKASKSCEYLTVSLGVVCCIADDALNEDILLSRADEMLYEAKETGRDRYIITSNVSQSTAKNIADMTA